MAGEDSDDFVDDFRFDDEASDAASDVSSRKRKAPQKPLTSTSKTNTSNGLRSSPRRQKAADLATSSAVGRSSTNKPPPKRQSLLALPTSGKGKKAASSAYTQSTLSFKTPTAVSSARKESARKAGSDKVDDGTMGGSGASSSDFSDSDSDNELAQMNFENKFDSTLPSLTPKSREVNKAYPKLLPTGWTAKCKERLGGKAGKHLDWTFHHPDVAKPVLSHVQMLKMDKQMRQGKKAADTTDGWRKKSGSSETKASQESGDQSSGSEDEDGAGTGGGSALKRLMKSREAEKREHARLAEQAEEDARLQMDNGVVINPMLRQMVASGFGL